MYFCDINVGFVSTLQVRIEQVIIAEPGAVLLYKLSNLLKFYHYTIRYFSISRNGAKRVSDLLSPYVALVNCPTSNSCFAQRLLGLASTPRLTLSAAIENVVVDSIYKAYISICLCHSPFSTGCPF